jgi:predicted aminopeptidase
MSTSGNPIRFTTAMALGIGVLMLSGCETLQFYRQAIWGQWQLLAARVPVDDMLQAEQVTPEVATQLQLAQDIIDFAEREIGLRAQGRYKSFVQLDQDYVVWNVFAAEPYSVVGQQWCYPFVGCAPYRGYFNKVLAHRVAASYQKRGFETYVGEVPAYSTLGWFNDPLLSSFIDWPEPDLASLLIHELAHSRVWVKGDVAFNENFAEFVGNRGARLWLTSQGKSDAWQGLLARRSVWQNFRAFLLQAKAHLQVAYTGPQAQLARDKAAALADITRCYEVKRKLLGSGRYDELMADQFNNALLVSVGTYADYLPGFQQLFEDADENWSQFFDAVNSLGDLPQPARVERLTQLTEQYVAQQFSAQQQVGHAADDQDTDEVYCQTFASHSAD